MLEVIKAVFKVRWKYTIRYPGWLIMFFIFPIIFSVIPIVLGWAVAGSPQQAAINFKIKVGTEHYTLFMVLGSLVWLLSVTIMWDFGMWIREEQQMGTLEQILLTPVNIFELLLGSSLWALINSVIQFVVALIIAGIIFNFLDLLFTPGLVLCLVYLALGVFPLTGFALLIGSLIVRIKEAEAVIRLLQPIIAFLVGIFYPITLMPYFVRLIAMLIPLTITLHDTRAILMNLDYLFNPYLDIFILLIYCAIWPTIGFYTFHYVERKAKKEGMLGGY